MNPILLKSLIGVGTLGTTVAASVGGYYWLTAPSTIGDKLRGKELVGPYMKDDNDSENKEAWTTKMNSYKTTNENNEEAKKILSTDNITEKALSDKCKDILKTPLSDSNAVKMEEWAKKWCFKDDTTP